MCVCVAMVKSRREEREKTCLQGFVRWCCGGCMLVYCILDPFPLSSTSTCHCFVFVLHCDNAPRCHAPCCFEHLRFLSPTLSLPSHAHTHAHTVTRNPRALLFLFCCCCSCHCGVHSLENNNIGAEGAAAIAEALKSNSTLQEL